MCLSFIELINLIIGLVIGLSAFINPNLWAISGIIGLISGLIGGIITSPCCLCGFGGIGGFILDFVGAEFVECIGSFLIYSIAGLSYVISLGTIGDLIFSPLCLRSLTPGGILQIINILKQSLNSMLNLLTL
jgi:hypothetical protein